MRTAFSKLKETVDVNDTHAINFAKWTGFHASIKFVLRHKPPDVSETSTGVLAYLEGQLSGISLGSPMDHKLEQQSSKLFNQEEQIRNPPIRNQPINRHNKANRLFK